jgi:hypothetical protein
MLNQSGTKPVFARLAEKIKQGGTEATGCHIGCQLALR